jgi:hypothetical protein
MGLRIAPRGRHVVVVATLAALTLGLVACGDQSAREVTPAAPPTATAPATPTPPAATPPATTPPATTPPTTTPPPTTPAATPSATARGTAVVQLQDFLVAARTVDTRLHRAAALINAGITPDAVTVRPATVAAVEAADPATAARVVPAGLDRELLRRTMLVYSDPRSRRMAMQPVVWAGDGVVVLPRPGPVDTSPSAAEILDALGNGHAAAARFESDLAALRSLAARRPAFTPGRNTSRAAAEVDVRVAYIDGANGGCASTGGAVFTRLVPLAWGSGGGGRWTGTIGGIGFQAVYRYGGWWRVLLDAC